MIHFPFNFDKALQATACVLSKAPGRQMNYTKLLKLLYLADRAMLQQKGRSITGDHVVAMPNGPVVDTLYGLIKGAHPRFDADPDVPAFTRHIRGVGEYDVQLVADVGTGLLSSLELRILDEVYEQHKDHDFGRMIDICHQLDEWKRNDPGGSVKSLPTEDILRAVGREDWIERVRDEAAYQESIQATFGTVQT